MKEKIIEILKTYQIETSRGTMAVALFTEEEYANLASDINNTFDEVFNQEVEKRIAEVLPTKNEIGNACQLFDKQKRPLWKEAIWRAGANWAVDLIRSRLTCSEKPNNSQKTEGGEG